MIPAFNQSGVLPPYLGQTPAVRSAVSPYETTTDELVARYATSAARRDQLIGFLRMRQGLRQLGLAENSFQWVNGSFSEDIESTEGRNPNDIDVVTFGWFPTGADVNQLLQTYPELFDPAMAKAKFHCDAYFVDMTVSPFAIHSSTCYWYGLFSHKRVSNLWKGMLRVRLGQNDDSALMALGESP